MTADVIPIRDPEPLMFVCNDCSCSTFHIMSENGETNVVCAGCDIRMANCPLPAKWIDPAKIVEHYLSTQDKPPTAVKLRNQSDATFMLRRGLQRAEDILAAFFVTKDGYLSTYRKEVPEGAEQWAWMKRKLADATGMLLKGEE